MEAPPQQRRALSLLPVLPLIAEYCQQAPINGNYMIYEIILLHELPRFPCLFQDSNSLVKSKRLEHDLEPSLPSDSTQAKTAPDPYD